MKQDLETFAVAITCSSTSEKLTQARLSKERSQQLDDALNDAEREQFQSMVGSLMWICRCCRPTIGYTVSTLQSASKKPIVERYVKETKDVGLTYKTGVHWPSRAGEKLEMCIAAVSDASHGNEFEYLDDWELRESFRSQGAKVILITNTKAILEEEVRCHLISVSSTVQQRVVNSTIKSETYQLSDVVESADLIRAAIADVHGALDRKQWETTAAKFMKSDWLTDCRSAFDTLQKPIANTVDKRLGKELASPRSLIHL